MRVQFLGTGASGGTPGQGRSRRLESSALIGHRDTAVLVDATRDFADQAAAIDCLDAVLLTHAHRDASGGIPGLRRWLHRRGAGPVPVVASAEAIEVLHERYARLDHCEFVAVAPAETRSVAGFTVQPQTVPHARDPRFATYAWRLTAHREPTVVCLRRGRPDRRTGAVLPWRQAAGGRRCHVRARPVQPPAYR